jgi:hydroxymethylpyrimidine pyrophosphatase-like HAD family hydrolase
MASKKISLLLSDVDGTLLNSKKRITARAKAAIEKVHEAGIKFAVTSGRPPRGLNDHRAGQVIGTDCGV